MKITKENRNRAIFTQRELSRAADRAENAHEYLERIDQGLALEIAAAIETLREAERFIGNAVSDAGDAIIPVDERGATFRPETLDWHLSPETGTFVKTEGR